MDNNERFTFYEKYYFHELERKEKLISRLNLPLAILVGLLSFLGYMLNKAPSTNDGMAGALFWILYLYSLICLIVASWYFTSAWKRRGYDSILPTPRDLENYRVSLEKHFDTDTSAEQNNHFKETILSYYISGATKNSLNNDQRVESLNKLSIFAISAVFFSVSSFLPFYLANNS